MKADLLRERYGREMPSWPTNDIIDSILSGSVANSNLRRGKARVDQNHPDRAAPACHRAELATILVGIARQGGTCSFASRRVARSTKAIFAVGRRTRAFQTSNPWINRLSGHRRLQAWRH